MVINIVKHCGLFFDLKKYNSIIMDFRSRFSYNAPGEEYDFLNRKISGWFDPQKVRQLGISRTYPKHDPVQYRPEYCLLIHCSNYLPLFLMNTLYLDRKDVLFEDIGAGLGWLYVYLQKLGFFHFHTVEDFSQLSKESAQEFSDVCELNVTFNNLDLHPIVSNNVGVPSFAFRTMTPDLELIICYTNRFLEEALFNTMEPRGFKFLCRDGDDLAVAFCREDKFVDFQEKLQSFEMK